jgi:hypothetical protein
MGLVSMLVAGVGGAVSCYVWDCLRSNERGCNIALSKRYSHRFLYSHCSYGGLTTYYLRSHRGKATVEVGREVSAF